MAIEQFSNLAQSALNAGITNIQTSLVVNSAAGFPTLAAGQQFRIVVDIEVMIVTAVSTNTFTVQRGQEGSSAVAHNAGAVVAHVMTAAVAQSFQPGIGTFAAMPAAGNAGKQYYCTDTFSLYFDNGTLWIPITPPPGSIEQTAGPLPSGRQTCDGTALSTTASASLALYQVIGHTWDTFRGQAAPASGFYRVPFFNGLSLAAVGAAVAAVSSNPATSARVLAAIAGEEAHPLGNTEMPSQLKCPAIRMAIMKQSALLISARTAPAVAPR